VNVVLFALGLIAVVFTAASVLFTIVLPREPRGFERLSSLVNRVVQWAFIGVARPARTYERKDALLAPVAPVALIGQLAMWAGCFIVGYALMLEGTTHNLASALAQASGALFTVGTINLSGRTNFALDIAAGATWVVIVALQIAYLPALYQAFNRRESLVAMLESRAGVPAWGPELLARHPTGGDHRHPPAVLFVVGAVVCRAGREPHDLPGHAVVSIAGSLVLMAGRSLGGAGRRRDASGPCPRNRLIAIKAVPTDGIHRAQPDSQSPGLEH
jgi:hypothetical protein